VKLTGGKAATMAARQRKIEAKVHNSVMMPKTRESQFQRFVNKGENDTTQ